MHTAISPRATDIRKVVINDKDHYYIGLTFGQISPNFKRLSKRGLALIPIILEDEMIEGMRLHCNGEWYELFMFDFKNNVYYLEKEGAN